MEKETNYGNFAEPIESKNSKRSEDVVLTALGKCEQLMQKVNDLCRLIGEKDLEIQRIKEQLKLLKGEKE